MWTYRLRKTVSRMLYRGIAQVYTIAMAHILHKARPRVPKVWLVPQIRTAIDTADIFPSLPLPFSAAL